jgi:hypothetical protein
LSGRAPVPLSSVAEKQSKLTPHERQLAALGTLGCRSRLDERSRYDNEQDEQDEDHTRAGKAASTAKASDTGHISFTAFLFLITTTT